MPKSRGSPFRKRPAPLRSPARSKRLIDNMEEIERRLVELEPAIPLGRISYPLKDLRRHIQKICKALSKQRDRSREPCPSRTLIKILLINLFAPKESSSRNCSKRNLS